MELQQPGDLGVLRGVILGFSEEARTRGFPSPPFGGFGFLGVASDLIIAAGWQFGGSSPMSALGHKRTFSAILAQCPLWSGKRTLSDPILEHLRPMSSFLNSGRSDSGNTADLRVRYRPQAVIRIDR